MTTAVADPPDQVREDIHKLAGAYVRLMTNYGRLLEELERQDEALALEQNTLDRRKERLAKRRQQVTRFCPDWVECLVRPIADAAAREFPGCTVVRGAPLGAAQTIWVELVDRTAGVHRALVMFRPGRLQIGELLVLDSTKGDQFVPLKSIEQALAVLRKQLEAKRRG